MAACARTLRWRAFLINLESLMTVKLGLGTVQLGLPYGNKAQSPLMPLTEAFDILEFALSPLAFSTLPTLMARVRPASGNFI